ncbi:MAG: GNAT family N-acetyltransferase [Chloroflexi bacterium]|nr:GNAT family N-acetyltransferase [Chloroflexota bacterium]MCC6894693.1 GNAT family N-acetyltransferase [Anaerolineae bacterium]
MTIEYRVVEDPEELKAIVDLQTIVWSMPASEAVPHNMLFAIVHGGGNVIRADLDGELVGFSLGLAALHGDEHWLWSHMAGVVPGHQGKGIGSGIKYAQRRWALDHGYKVIAWTFDPLQRGNANFNMHILKAAASTYHVNFYGNMTDGINAGMPSDRMEAVWDLLAEPVIAAEATPATAPIVTDFPRESFLVYSDDDGLPHVQLPSAWTNRYYFAEIPTQISKLKRENLPQAQAWQAALRQAAGGAFAQGYKAVDFADEGQRCWYILEKS